jgi:hypothetical protein
MVNLPNSVTPIKTNRPGIERGEERHVEQLRKLTVFLLEIESI